MRWRCVGLLLPQREHCEEMLFVRGLVMESVVRRLFGMALWCARGQSSANDISLTMMMLRVGSDNPFGWVDCCGDVGIYAGSWAATPASWENLGKAYAVAKWLARRSNVKV